MDSQSLDGCIQKTLSSLYPPFEYTAATVLCQVFDVVEKTYRGDGLSYLIDFLIPAKRVLHSLQQEACLQYYGLLFRHAGWPLCIHEKIVLQLASIDWRLLQPGDFYFQVVPYLRKTPRIVLKCLAQDYHNIEELVLPEVSYTSIFNLEWLEFINSGRMGISLENCLLMSDDQIFRVPWERVVHPEFIDKAQPHNKKAGDRNTIELYLECNKGMPQPSLVDLTVQHFETVNVDSVSGETSYLDTELQVKTMMASSELEGEYVELSDISVPRLGPQLGSLTQSIALNYKSQQKAVSQQTQDKQNHVLVLDSRTCKMNVVSLDTMPTLCSLQPSKKVTFSHKQATQQNVDIQNKIMDLTIGESMSQKHLNQESLFSTGSTKHSISETFITQNSCLEYEDISEITLLEKVKDTGDIDKCTQNCEQPSSQGSNFRTSLLFQQESRSHFINGAEDVRVVIDALQQPAAEHSRPQETVLVEYLHSSSKAFPQDVIRYTITDECDQSVPSLDTTTCLFEKQKSEENTANPEESAENRNAGSHVKFAFVAAESCAPGVAVLQQGSSNRDLCTGCGEQVDDVNKELVSRALQNMQLQNVQSLEQREQEHKSDSHNSEQVDPHHSMCTLSGSEKLPLTLETLHEVVEDEQDLTDCNVSFTRAMPPSEDISKTALGKLSDQEERTGQDPQENCWQHLCHTPALSRRSNGQPMTIMAQDVNLEVLLSEMVYLPGTKDRNGRAVIIINTRHTAWLNPHCNASELGRLLLFFYSIPRKDCRSLGLTLLVDARRCSPVPALFKAFHIVQAAVPSCIHGVLMLVEKDLALHVEKPQGIQFDLVTSTKSLHKHIEASQLPLEFDGSFQYCHKDWIMFRMKLKHLQESCRNACAFLQDAIKNLHIDSLPNKAEDARLLLLKFGELMKMVLEDERLVQLQTEGGAILARLRKEESCVTHTEDYRDAVDVAAELYNQVDEAVHSLVKISNKRIQEMELVIEFEAFQEQFQEVVSWIEHVGEHLLKECSTLEDSLEVLLQTQRLFKEFYVVACEYCKRGRDILQKMEKWQNLSSTETQIHRLKLQKYREKVEDFSRRLEESRSQLQKTVTLYQFFDKAYEWALERMRHLASFSFDDYSSPEICFSAIEGLERYKIQHPEISEEKFMEMRELARELKNEKGTKQWKFAWSKCQEARNVLEKKLEAALRAKTLLSGEQSSSGTASQPREADGMEQKELLECNSNTNLFQSKPYNSPFCPRERKLGRVLCNRFELGNTVDHTTCKSSPTSDAGSIVKSVFRTRKMSLQSISGEDLSLDLLRIAPSGSSTPTVTPRPITRRLLRKAQSFDLPGTEGAGNGCQRRLSEPTRRGNTGVFIKGLEVSSTELVDRPCSPRLPRDWSAECVYSERRCSISSSDGRSQNSKLHHIIDEMVTTEREYVRSLWYISENYFLEMERLDLPQDLRGKRGIIFGNLEKLRDFHSQYFLKELESCCNHPLRVSHCFLRHKDQFGMYALYSKNKPRSDSLLASHGNIFFKNKQHLLGDKMDLASYLLKPIQRMSKYALLLKDLIKECGEAQEQELAYLRAAEEMVKFQLRHGNDLLAMDAIRDCDVNLKEQGQLVRQDEFTVCLGRKKCQRHVFLFEDLILFSKPKRIEGGLDVYIYKRSFKTADIGLTESSGDNGLRFEIWFRRRKSNDTHILQASNPETKKVWTSDIAKILWQQATRNKEIRTQEMVSMGVGNKPFLDIKPSDAAINNRAIDFTMKGRGARTRASIAVSFFDHSDPYKRSQAPISCSSVSSAGGPSSASLLGPLNLHTYVNQTLLSGVFSASRPFDTSSCLEEDELENETNSSQPSMTTESSESSQCMSGAGSSGSDSGCVSNIPQDNVSEDAGSPTDASAPYSIQEERNTSSPRFPLVEKSKFSNCQYISANPSHICLSPSTIV
ncbi:rho guanine nucleotide exchange factor 40 isoform X2 [Xenopus laevis]|uniref:Rho guanine nucleotide exchange factor 40 isoform X2 n=2 Tax=Xenopus laevis TaxID=8355 RepID=A0A1L8GFD9_XENLA|nr:rho guanine nucleotide exchange factor 40 isoform X2 [Xenopus laevis]OCT82485.1 hypothetical protein XELAEV_18025016mg [Xenopus laevis]